jgi:hypothetical protein
MVEVAVALQASPPLIPLLGRLSKLLPPSSETNGTAFALAAATMSHTFDPRAANPTSELTSSEVRGSCIVVQTALVTADDARSSTLH